MISLDVFDTLILRPFRTPTDLFHTLEGKWQRAARRNMTSFAQARIEAESCARAWLPETQADVTMWNIYSAMMQKGKSFGNKKTQEITTTFEATFKLHKNFNVKADFSYTQGYLHNDYRSVNVQYSQYPGEVMTEPEGSFPNKYKEVVWDQNYYVADVYGTYNKTFSEKHNLTLIAGYNYEAKYYRDLTAANDGLLSEDLSDFNLAKGTTNFTLNGGRN